MTRDAAQMVILRDAAGEFTLDAEFLAGHFDWPVEALRNYMRRGMVASTVERGEGEDEGRWRLSVRCGNRRWQAIVNETGAILSEQIEIVPLQAGGG
ncbi:DUF6522 family protein [Aquamicrobium segne]|uniref:DUF6522 family protein n=1 Tax=Aquamicrobium segne TaxID=469547 RepID=A0ABW0GUV0_9HYPH